MEYVTLGRTGLRVSVMSLGSGGSSRLGLKKGAGEAEAAGIVKSAVEQGINLIDTAEDYGTEKVVGLGLRDVNRDEVVISTKYSLYEDGVLRTPEKLEQSLDASLSLLQTDYVDIYHLHKVLPADYPYALRQLVPQMIKMREKGKIRFIGITEQPPKDPSHEMLKRAVQDPCWDVMMVAFSMLNQSAREQLLQAAIAQHIGVLNMFAVRRALSNREALIELIDQLIAQGHLHESQVDREQPLGFLVHEHGAGSVIEAAYRYARHEPGIHSVLMGTGSLRHLTENIRSINKPSLPEQDLLRIKSLFSGFDFITGN